MTTHLDVSPDFIEQLAWDTGAQIRLDPETRRMCLTHEGERWISTPLPVIGGAS